MNLPYTSNAAQIAQHQRGSNLPPSNTGGYEFSGNAFTLGPLNPYENLGHHTTQTSKHFDPTLADSSPPFHRALSLDNPPRSADNITSLTLQDLLVNPVVQDLFREWTTANRRISEALETQSCLHRENLKLAAEIQSMRTGYSGL